MSVVNKSQVKNMAAGSRVSAGFYDELDRFVEKAVLEAKKRAESNGRSTLMPYDL